MLFSGKKYVFKLFGCLKIHFTENQFRCLVRSNIFTENALHSQATQFSIHLLSVNMLIMNQFHTHSQKKQNPAKKENQIQSNWDSVVEEKVRSEARSEQRWDRAEARLEARSKWRDQAARLSGAVLRSMIGAIVRQELGLWSLAKSLLPLSLRSGLSLSLSLSLFWFAEAFGSLALSLFCAWKETVWR